MKILATALLAGAAVASINHPQQQVLKTPAQRVIDQPIVKNAWYCPHHLESVFRHLKPTTDAFWSKLEQYFPGASKQIPKTSGRAFTRRPDSEWDHITKGSDLQSVWVTNAQGDKERKVGGRIESYDLRSRSVDTSKLGVDTVKQFSGYLDEKKTDKHLFYWFFESRNDPENDPVVLWLNGGPGCSSLLGLFMELGPSKIDKSANPVFNDYSWNANASVIFLDQPVNVGFSYSSDSVSSSLAAAKDVYALLTLFFETFPQYASQPFHIAGESYAGHYIPVMAAEILSHKTSNINLQSVAIGNGLTDGLTQYEYYKPMACGDGGYPAVLDKQTCDSLDAAYPRCAALIEACYSSESVWACVPASIYCNNALLGPYQQTGQNVYDIRTKCAPNTGGLCYNEMNWVEKYLNEDKIKAALGVEVDEFQSCNMDINSNFLFAGDWFKPVYKLIPGILKKIPVLIYAGDADFICNWLGNRAWADALDWPGQKSFNKAKYEYLNVTATGEAGGEYKSASNFTFARMYQAGHMVPYDQPEAALQMFNEWIGGEWWET
ncbi:MAG: hypothetical protein M1814_005564 [Vezdaea aestivalis]|nr:MAG: hypothetical protein M1814_005564 [Vezdaea aestivalis]